MNGSASTAGRLVSLAAILVLTACALPLNVPAIRDVSIGIPSEIPLPGVVAVLAEGGSAIAIYREGKLDDAFRLPLPARVARLTSDGELVLAVLFDDVQRGSYLWRYELKQRKATSFRLPLTLSRPSVVLHWSPDIRRFAFLDPRGTLTLVRADGQSRQINVPPAYWAVSTDQGDRIQTVSWRGSSEVSFVTTNAPLPSDAQVWLWPVGGALGRMEHALGLAAPLVSWSPDGGRLAYVGRNLRGQMAVRLHAASVDDVVFDPSHLPSAGDDLEIFHLLWSADGRRLGVIGRAIGAEGRFAALVTMEAGPKVFVSPPSCYPRSGVWGADDFALACIQATADGESRLYVLDRDTAQVRTAIRIGSKPLLHSDAQGQWVVVGEQLFIPLRDPGAARTLRLGGFVGMCCADAGR